MSTVSNTSNGMFAVIEALAAADAAGVTAQASSVDDLTTSEFMQGLQRIISDYGHNIKAIENFLKSYLASHQSGTARERMTTESVLSLQGLDTMVNKLSDYDAQLSSAKAELDKCSTQVDACQKKMDNLKGSASLSYNDWYTYYLGQMKYCPLAYLNPFSYAGIAGAALQSYTAAQADFGNAASQLASAMQNQQAAQTKCNGIEKSEIALTSGTSSTMGNRATTLSGPANSVIQTANQLASLGFMFVGLLQNLNGNNPES